MKGNSKSNDVFGGAHAERRERRAHIIVVSDTLTDVVVAVVSDVVTDIVVVSNVASTTSSCSAFAFVTFSRIALGSE